MNRLLMLFLGVFLAAGAYAQGKPASTYTVVKGDDVPGIVKKLKYPDVTESQMYYAVVKKNINVFSVNTVERVTPGMQLEIPSQADVKKVNVKEADQYMADLRKAEVIYSEGVAAEQKNDMKTAVEKYLAAAKIGHAVAAVKLGQLYDKGVTKTMPRDLQESIHHYQSARERGREVKGPGSRAPQPVN
jgi:Tfp pilus assembly protein FimV